MDAAALGEQASTLVRTGTEACRGQRRFETVIAVGTSIKRAGDGSGRKGLSGTTECVVRAAVAVPTQPARHPCATVFSPH